MLTINDVANKLDKNIRLQVDGAMNGTTKELFYNPWLNEYYIMTNHIEYFRTESMEEVITTYNLI